MSANILQRIRQEDPPLLIQRFIHVFPFLFAVATLILLIWSVYFLTIYPYDGVVINSKTQRVVYVDPEGPTSNIIMTGDILGASLNRELPTRIPPYLIGQENINQKIHIIRGGEPIGSTPLNRGRS